MCVSIIVLLLQSVLFGVQQRIKKSMSKVVKTRYFVVLEDQIMVLSAHYEDKAAESQGSIFFTPGSTVRKTSPTEFTFTGAEGEDMVRLGSIITLLRGLFRTQPHS